MHPNRRVVFESVRRVREGNEPHRHLPFAQHEMRIPEQDFYALCKLYPDMNNFRDPAAREEAWNRFRASPFSEPYKVGRVVRGITKNGVILK